MRLFPDEAEFCSLSLKLTSLRLSPFFMMKTALRMMVVMRMMKMAMAMPRMVLLYRSLVDFK